MLAASHAYPLHPPCSYSTPTNFFQPSWTCVHTAPYGNTTVGIKYTSSLPVCVPHNKAWGTPHKTREGGIAMKSSGNQSKTTTQQRGGLQKHNNEHTHDTRQTKTCPTKYISTRAWRLHFSFISGCLIQPTSPPSPHQIQQYLANVHVEKRGLLLDSNSDGRR